jgi:hypothetical protein
MKSFIALMYVLAARWAGSKQAERNTAFKKERPSDPSQAPNGQTNSLNVKKGLFLFLTVTREAVD